MITHLPFREIQNPHGIFRLTWCVNNICTNHCRYCPDLLHRGQNRHYEWHHAESFSRQILALNRPVELSITGGEPTVSPWLPQLIKMFTSRSHRVTVTTNGVRSGDYWAQSPPSALSVSYHAAWDDGHWFDRLVATGAKVPNTVARIMMDPLHWDQCLEQFDQILRETDLGLEPVRLQDWGADRVVYRPTQLAQLQRLMRLSRPAPRQEHWHLSEVQGQPVGGTWANQLISRGQNRFSGWSCTIGQDSLFVQFDGSYRRGNCDQGGYLGWIWDQIPWPREPVGCQRRECQYTTDILTAKSCQQERSDPAVAAK